MGGQSEFPSDRMGWSLDPEHRGPLEIHDMLPRGCDKLSLATAGCEGCWYEWEGT